MSTGTVTAAPPNYAAFEGQQAAQSLDINGNLRTTGGGGGGGAVTQGTIPWITNDPGLPDTVGQKTAALSTSMVLALDQGPIQVTGEQATTAALTNVTMTGSTLQLLAANANRAEVIITNNGTVNVFIAYGTAAISATGILLPAGTTIADDVFQGAINAIGASGVVSVMEVTP